MPRKPKRKAPNPPIPPTPEWSKDFPKGFYVTSIPGMRESGVDADGILSQPGNLANDLYLIELGREIGKSNQKKRKSSQDIIRRNVEICDLRKQNEAYWSHGQLVLKYGLKRQTISRILKQETKWRYLASKL